MQAISSGDTAFLLTAAALVMFMTPGLALFYAGMVRQKNVLGTIMQSFIALGVVTIIWVLVGFTLAFGPDKAGVIGGLKYLGLGNVGAVPLKQYAPTVPALAFVMYQGMFAVITPALISGAFAERMRFSAYLIFISLWSLVVYAPVAHWVWGVGGWLRELGALDFAGGTVVHISSGASALVTALVLGKRVGFKKEAILPHNVTMTVTGAAILWFGWFGFNAGSALASGSLAATAFATTHISAAAATLSWVAAEWLRSGKPTTLGAASGAVAGLVGITPAAGFVGPLGALVIGLITGVVCYFAVSLKWRLGYDDSLDVVGVHLAGGTTGALLTGVLASTVINAAGGNGLVHGNPALPGIQAVGVVATIAYAMAVTFVLLKVIELVTKIRLSAEEESAGLDVSQHGEEGYILR